MIKLIEEFTGMKTSGLINHNGYMTFKGDADDLAFNPETLDVVSTNKALETRVSILISLYRGDLSEVKKKIPTKIRVMDFTLLVPCDFDAIFNGDGDVISIENIVAKEVDLEMLDDIERKDLRRIYNDHN